MAGANYYLPLLVSLVPNVLIFALWAAATLAAARRAREHLAWLVTMTVSRGIGLFGSLVNFAYTAAVLRTGGHTPQAALLLTGQEVLAGLSTLFAVAGAILLLLRFLAPQERVS